MDAILYRWWDADGKLLYVGKSVSLYARIAAHRRKSEFFREAATMTLERFASPEDLSKAEITAIRAERPAYNVQHSIGPGGDTGRTITVLDGPAPEAESPQNGVGYWTPAHLDSIKWGDIIRCVASDGDVEFQGLVDDNYGPEDDDDEFGGWVVITDSGDVVTVSDLELDGFFDTYRWVCADPDDPYRAHVLDAYFDRIKEAVA